MPVLPSWFAGLFSSSPLSVWPSRPCQEVSPGTSPLSTRWAKMRLCAPLRYCFDSDLAVVLSQHLLPKTTNHASCLAILRIVLHLAACMHFFCIRTSAHCAQAFQHRSARVCSTPPPCSSPSLCKFLLIGLRPVVLPFVKEVAVEFFPGGVMVVAVQFSKARPKKRQVLSVCLWHPPPCSASLGCVVCVRLLYSVFLFTGKERCCLSYMKGL